MAKFYATRSLTFYIVIGFLAFASQIVLFGYGYAQVLSQSGEIIAGLIPIALAVITFFYLLRRLYFTDLFFQRPLSSTIAVVSLIFAFLNGMILLIAG